MIDELKKQIEAYFINKFVDRVIKREQTQHPDDSDDFEDILQDCFDETESEIYAFSDGLIAAVELALERREPTK